MESLKLQKPEQATEAKYEEIESGFLNIYSIVSNPSAFVDTEIASTAQKLEEACTKLVTKGYESLLNVQEHRIEIVRFINSIYFQVPRIMEEDRKWYSEALDECLQSIQSSLYLMLQPIEHDLYKNPDKYKLSKYDLSKDRFSHISFPANDLFSLFSVIQTKGGGMRNYLYLVEEACVKDGVMVGNPFTGYDFGVGNKELINVLYDTEQGLFRDAADRYFQELFEKKEWYQFEEILMTEYGRSIRETIFKKINHYFKIFFQIDDPHFAEKLNYSFGSMNENISHMSLIEHSRRGGVKKLNKVYNICEFRRYPPELLVRQLEEENEQKPYGLMIFPRSDHNGAFADNMDTKIADFARDIDGKKLLRIFEAGSKIDVARIFLSCDEKYGEENKVSFLVLGGHGNVGLIDLGSHTASTIDKKRGKFIYDHDFITGKGVKNVKKFFTDKPSIALISCSTGDDMGIINQFSSTYDADVVAPKVPTAMKAMHAKFDKTGHMSLDIDWCDEDVGNRYIAGKKLDDKSK